MFLIFFTLLFPSNSSSLPTCPESCTICQDVFYRDPARKEVYCAMCRECKSQRRYNEKCDDISKCYQFAQEDTNGPIDDHGQDGHNPPNTGQDGNDNSNNNNPNNHNNNNPNNNNPNNNYNPNDNNYYNPNNNNRGPITVICQCCNCQCNPNPCPDNNPSNNYNPNNNNPNNNYNPNHNNYNPKNNQGPITVICQCCNCQCNPNPCGKQNKKSYYTLYVGLEKKKCADNL